MARDLTYEPTGSRQPLVLPRFLLTPLKSRTKTKGKTYPKDAPIDAIEFVRAFDRLQWNDAKTTDLIVSTKAGGAFSKSLRVRFSPLPLRRWCVPTTTPDRGDIHIVKSCRDTAAYRTSVASVEAAKCDGR